MPLGDSKSMRPGIFVVIVILSGVLAGTVYGIANLILVEPLLDEAISIENQMLFEEKTQQDTPEFRADFQTYRDWQKAGQVFSSMILGVSFGSLFGIVYWFVRNSLPGSDIKKALILAGIIWLVVFMVPFLKYPANLPAVGDPETVDARIVLYVGIIAISAASAVGMFFVSKVIPRFSKPVAICGYATIIAISFVLLPQVSSENTISSTLLENFRIASVITVSLFWFSFGSFFGLFWQRYDSNNMR